MVGLEGLITLAQNYTWLMVVFLWIGTAAGFKVLHNDISDQQEDLEAVEAGQDQIAEQVNRVDQKQDHVVSRQEMILERMGMNAQEIQELREETARLDERHNHDDDSFYRGGTGD